jgi:hypothetical protein
LSSYIRKDLALGPIRFGVLARHGGSTSPADEQRGFSTGPAGEYRRLGKEVLFMGDQGGPGAPSLRPQRTAGQRSLWEALKPEDGAGYGRVAMMVVGILFILLGLMVWARKGPQGLAEVVIGLALLTTPIITTARKLREIRAREEERQAEEARRQKMMGQFAAALKRLEANHDRRTLEEVGAERRALEVPYDMVAPSAKTAVLRVAFQEIARSPRVDADALNRLLDDAAAAVGLSDEDRASVKASVYQTLVWHLLVDDRLTDNAENELRGLRKRLGISDEALSKEDLAISEFRRLRSLTEENLPTAQCAIALNFQENCYHHTRGTFMKKKSAKVTKDGLTRSVDVWEPDGDCELFVTNKRLVVRKNKKESEIPIYRIDEIDLDPDHSLLTIGNYSQKKPLLLSLPDPIYTARVIDLAASMGVNPARYAG